MSLLDFVFNLTGVLVWTVVLGTIGLCVVVGLCAYIEMRVERWKLRRKATS